MPRLRDIARRAVQNPWLMASRCPNYAFEFEQFFEMTRSAFPSATALAPQRG
jgi:hypothetical protein